MSTVQDEKSGGECVRFERASGGEPGVFIELGKNERSVCDKEDQKYR